MRLFYIFFLTIAMNCINLCFAHEAPLIDTVDEYLRSIQTLTGSFVQSGGGENRSGRIYVKKPGNLRVEYLSPFKELIITTDKLAMHYDAELQEKNYINLDDVYFATLFNQKFSLKKDTNIASIYEAKGMITASFTLKKNPDVGIVSVTIATKPSKLVSIAFASQDSDVKMHFTKVLINSNVSDNQFDFDNTTIK